MPSDAPRAATPATGDAPSSHPNLPRRGLLALMFAAIVACGIMGGGIGYGLVRTSCPSRPTVAEKLLEQVPGFHAHAPACGLKLLAGGLTGSALTAFGGGVVAVLMLRAQSEWRAHPAGRSLMPPPGGGTPPRT